MIYCSQRRTQNLWHIYNNLFCKNSLQFKVVNNFNMKLYFKIYYGVLNLPRVFFFRFTFSIDLFISPNIFKNVCSSSHKCLFKVYTRSIALGVGAVQIWQHVYHSNVCHVVLKFWLTLGRSLYYFLLLTLNILCLFWMSLNATLWHIFVENQIGVIFMGVVAKIS